MRITILGCGTSTGVPVPACQCKVCLSNNPKNKRLRTSALVTLDSGANILIDSSTDFRTQALRANILHLDAVLYTHAHADHIFGLDDIRGFNFTQGSAIPVYASTKTLKELKRIFKYAFDNDPSSEGGNPPEIEVHQIVDSVPFEINDTLIQPIPALHGTLPVYGFRFANIAYLTDCNHIPESSLKMLLNLDYLFLDGLRYEEHKTHFTIPEAIQIAQTLKVKQTYLIHTTHSVDYEEVMRKLPQGIALAYDELTVP